MHRTFPPERVTASAVTDFESLSPYPAKLSSCETRTNELSPTRRIRRAFYL